MPDLNLPSLNTGEVTLIGTGGGYGESVVVHLGNNKWVVIDSCINPLNRHSLPLEYLQAIGVDVSQDVVLVICTHWHDDHIQGMSELFQHAQSAKFCLARIHDVEKFIRFLKIDSSKENIEDAEFDIASSREFLKCMQIVGKRGKPSVYAYIDRLLYDEGNVQVYALSPTDKTGESFDKEIDKYYQDRLLSPDRKITTKHPNGKSVVLYIKYKTHCVVLGADLENSGDPNEGWEGIVNNTVAVTQPASLYKVPHHGSNTGDFEGTWKVLLEPHPISKLTPWNRKDKLPQVDSLENIIDRSSAVFITCPVLGNTSRKRSRRVEKLIDFFNKRLREEKFIRGLVRSRIEIFDPSARWIVDTFDSAIKVA